MPGPIYIITDLPFELESKTCTCRKRASYVSGSKYSIEWKRQVHAACGKPEQDQVIYQCADCEQLFISKTLRPMTGTGDNYLLHSVLYIARMRTSPNYEPSWDDSRVGEVFCGNC